MRRTGTVGTAMAAAVAGLLLAAPGASALTTVSVKGVDQGDYFSGTATCPAGQTVVSGGFETESDGTAVVNKAQGNDSWYVETVDADGLTVTANCSKRLDPSTSSKAKKFGDGQSGRNTKVRATCKRGEVVAGGWRYQPAGSSAQNSPVFTSTRKGSDKWTVTAVHDEPDATTKIRSYAYCLIGKDIKARTRTGDVDSNDDGRARVTCRRGEELLGGGFKTTPRPDWENNTGPDNFYFTSQRFGARTWLARAHNHSSVDGKVVTTAICRQ